MKFAVIDDDKAFLNLFYNSMLPYVKNNEVDFYDSSSMFLHNINNKEKYYDAIFLDIDMPTINGIELSKKIYKEINSNCLIIFITNKKEMVYDAFGINVLSFIYKPDFSNKIQQVFNSLYTISEYNKSILINLSSGKTKLRIRDIYYIEKTNRKVLLCIGGKEKKYVNYRNLMDLDDIIKHPYFVYINRSVRINLIHVKQIVNDTIYLNNGENFGISKSKIKEITDLFVEMNFN